MQVPAQVGSGEYEDRGSRFLAWVFEIADEEAFKEKLAAIKKQHSKARHWCWAWRLGDAYRFEDDGEPGGTAGRPMLQVLEGRQLQNVAAICVRYFGGVQLGTGGLVRAYGGATAKAVDQAGTRTVIPRITLDVRLPFPRLGALEEIKAKFPSAIFRGEFNDTGWIGTIEMDEPDAPQISKFFWEPPSS
jgi:uncharacterized YigZ family protein